MPSKPARKRLPYENTTVPVLRTRQQLRDLVKGWGGDRFGDVESEETYQATVQFVIPYAPEPGQEGELRIRMHLPLPRPDEERFVYSTDGHGYRRKRLKAAATAAFEQEVRRRWRCFYNAIRQKLVNIDTGISDEVSEFEPDIVVPSTGRTWREHTEQAIRLALRSGVHPSWLKALPEQGGPDA